MNKKLSRAALLCLLLAALTVLFAACSGGGDTSSEEETEPVCPITINGTKITVGETTVGSLLDQGCVVYWVDDDYERVTVDPDQELEANAYYTGGAIQVTDDLSALISFVTDEEPIPMRDAVIARMEFTLAGKDDPEVLDKIEFDGVPLSQLTREKAGEMYPDWTGDEVMWLMYGLDYKYDLDFDMSTGKIVKFSAERKYDVDWTG